MSTSKLARLFAELIGSFVLTAVVLSVGKTYGTPLFTTIAAATTIVALTLMLSPVSGGHFNPAITLGLFSIRRVSLLKTILYVFMQAIGGFLAWKAFEQFSPDRPVLLGATEFDWPTFFAEMMGSAVFAMGFAAVVLRRYVNGHAAATIGMAFFGGSVAASVVIIGRQIVTGVLNPAVAIGIGYRPENLSYVAYFFGPVVGAVIGMNMYRWFFTDRAETASASAASFKPVSPVVASKAVAKKKLAAKKKTAAKPKTTRRTTKR